MVTPVRYTQPEGKQPEGEKNPSRKQRSDGSSYTQRIPCSIAFAGYERPVGVAFDVYRKCMEEREAFQNYAKNNK